MKTVEVTTELIKEVHSQVSTDLKQRIEKELPDLFNKLEVGKWYKSKGGLYCITNIKDDLVSAYGFEDEYWRESGSFKMCFGINDVLATEEEVKTALVNECKKRELTKGKAICLYDKTELQIYSDGEFVFTLKDNDMWFGGVKVYKNGIFAKKITEPTEKELLGDKIKDLEKNLEEVKSLYDKL